MGVMRQRPVGSDVCDAPHRDVLPDLGYQVGARLLDAPAIGQRLACERLHVGSARCHGDIGDSVSKGNEVLVLRDEIRFGIHFDDDSFSAVRLDNDFTVRRDPACLLVGFGLAGLAQ